MSELEAKSGNISQVRTVLQWAGIAGIMGGIVFTLVPVVPFGFAPAALVTLGQ